MIEVFHVLQRPLPAFVTLCTALISRVCQRLSSEALKLVALVAPQVKSLIIYTKFFPRHLNVTLLYLDQILELSHAVMRRFILFNVFE